jgi:hypothetical protein
VAVAVRTDQAAELARINVPLSTLQTEASAASRAATNQAEHDATQNTLASGTIRADVRAVNGTAIQGTGAANNVRKFLFTRDYEYLRSYWPNESLTEEPVFYADYNYTNWLILPPPDEEYPFEVLYYELPVLLDDENQTNWLTDYAPQVLLYASLLEATPFLKNDERIPVWQQMYDRSAAMLNGEDLAKILDRSAVRKEA